VKRLTISPRRNWQSAVEELGLKFHTPEGHPYWEESVCYRFDSREVDELEAATEELQRLCLAAGQFIIDKDRFDDFHIPQTARQAIRDAWEAEPPSIYGRFDLMYNGKGPPKLLEYNANTPTALLESAVVQWYWLEEVMKGRDQFNSVHEKLIEKWKDLKPYIKGGLLCFTAMDNAEDITTVSYLRDTAHQAGIATEALLIKQIGWNERAREFRDADERRIDSIFSLYPWEWLLKDFAGPLLEVLPTSVWIEPIWKMMWSNKALLAVLWEMYPKHPNLLEAHLDGPHAMYEYVKKPLFGREGANITMHTLNWETSTQGPYGEGGYVYQALAPRAAFDGKTPVLGSWYITDQGSAGIGIRESDGPITDNLSRFVPHYFD
jgi:glutathionylspermidine synthase